MSVQSVWTAGWNLAREILSHVSGRDECLYSQCEQQDGVCFVRYYPMSPGVMNICTVSANSRMEFASWDIIPCLRAWGLQPCTGRALLCHEHVRINTPFSPVILPPLLLLIVTDAKDHVDDVCLWFLCTDWPSPSSPTEILSGLIRQTYNTSFPKGIVTFSVPCCCLHPSQVSACCPFQVVCKLSFV